MSGRLSFTPAFKNRSYNYANCLLLQTYLTTIVVLMGTDRMSVAILITKIIPTPANLNAYLRILKL